MNFERCYLEPMINGINRVFLPDTKQMKICSSSLYDATSVHLFPSRCTLWITASYEGYEAAVKVEGVPVVYIDRKATDTVDVLTVLQGSVIEIHPGALVYVLEFSNIRKQCINLSTKGPGVAALKSKQLRWRMFTGGQLFTCTSAGFDESRTKVASFDLDGTLIKSKSGGTPKDHNDWMLWDDSVIPFLSKVHDDGYKVIIFTNQGGILKSESSLKLHFFKMKIENVVNSLGVPVQACIATFQGGPYRKPIPGMWKLMECNCGVRTDLEKSFFVGDAAGRKQDIAVSDRIFAENIGLKFHTPEEIFLNELPSPHVEKKFPLDCFDPNLKMPNLEFPSEEQEVIIMVGPQSSGKTTFVETYLIPAGYVPVSLDYFDNWDVSSDVLANILERKKRAVIDHRNWEVRDRWKFVYLCKQRQVRVRCFVMDWSVNRCIHNNRFRKIFEPKHFSISPSLLENDKKKFETPTMEEGFAGILSIPFIPTFRCDEMKFLYNCYLHAQ